MGYRRRDCLRDSTVESGPDSTRQIPEDQTPGFWTRSESCTQSRHMKPILFITLSSCKYSSHCLQVGAKMNLVPIGLVACLLLAYGARSQTTQVISLVPKPVVVKVGPTLMLVVNRHVQACAKMPHFRYLLLTIMPVCSHRAASWHLVSLR